MIEALGQPLLTVAQYTASKAGKTGLMVTCDVWRYPVGGPWSQIVTAGACVEIGKGAYSYVLSSTLTTTKGFYLFVFSTTDATVDQQNIIAGWPSIGADWIQAASKIGSGVATIVSPVSPDGTLLTLVRGDDYKAADGRGLDFSVPATASWPDLTGATIKMTVRSAAFDAVIFGPVTGSVVTPTGTNAKVRVEPLSASTKLLTPGVKVAKFDVEATLAVTNDIVTLASGFVTVVEDQTRQ